MKHGEKGLALWLDSRPAVLSVFNLCFIRGYLTFVVVTVYVAFEVGDSQLGD